MSSKENKNVIKSEAFRQQSEEHHSRRKMGVGETYPTYHYADFEKWLSATVPETSNEIIHEQNETVQNVMRACDWLANKYLFPYERKNGPSFADRNYAAFGYRCTCIIVQEFGIKDPMVLATTYLANIYTKIPPETISHFNEDLKRVFLQRTFVVQLQKNLEHFMFLDNRYDNLANTIVLDPPAQSSVGCKKRIEEGIRFGFTPESYEELKGDVQEKFIEDDTKELRYFTTEELFAYAANGFSPDSESSQQVGGLATMLAMMSQAIDKHRYPRHTSDRMARQNISIQKENIRDALNVSHNLLPLARTLDLQPAVRALQEVVADTFFPEQWKALQQSLEKQSGSYSHVQVRNGRKRSRLQKRDSGIYFDTQTSMNTRAVHEYVRQQLENIDVDALYVSAGEFEKRKFKKLQNKSDEPILAPNEYTVFEGKKGPGSIFDKWLNECRTKKLYSKRWYGNCRAGQEQTALRERFKDPKVWEEYIFGATDIIRCSVVFGQELAQIFTLPKGHPNEQNTFLAVVHLQYRDSPAEEKWDSDIINHVRSNRVNPDQKFQSVSERSEAEEFRIDPFFDIDGFLRFEYHQLLLLNPENKGIRNLQFEIHCLSEVQYWVNNFKEQLHILFKLKSSKKRRSLDPEQVVRIVASFQEIKRNFYKVMYGKAL